MGLFSNIFKSKPRVTYDTQLGLFTLVYSSGTKNTWTSEKGEVLLSVRGSKIEPHADHLIFIENWRTEISRLTDEISKRFIREFKDADLPIDFTDWSNKFKIVAIEVMLIFEHEAYWNITFEELKKPFAHFKLFIEGPKLTDFSIDT